MPSIQYRAHTQAEHARTAQQARAEERGDMKEAKEGDRKQGGERQEREQLQEDGLGLAGCRVEGEVSVSQWCSVSGVVM